MNTLNNIHTLIETDAGKAQSAVERLSVLMRYLLYDSAHNTINLKKEIEFIHSFISLMQLRHSDEVEVKVLIPDQIPDIQIPPMLFISLIENAFKHGISHSQPSFIHIDIHQIDGNRLFCSIQNSYVPKDETDRSGSGIGLENLNRRLEILYPHNHIIRTEREGDSFLSELIIPLNNLNNI